ncbi:hypothetical protein OUZ56_008556 [Daphnia magna]|uniref:Uncharacterized protein n=1 Tax=Daphnia magna TaxID=35525 RepID=A0ABR0ADQ7_9CRUS|nr:hypothetical protein OUZ56_008556 [Daphnia magna]
MNKRSYPKSNVREAAPNVHQPMDNETELAVWIDNRESGVNALCNAPPSLTFLFGFSPLVGASSCVLLHRSSIFLGILIQLSGGCCCSSQSSYLAQEESICIDNRLPVRS